MMPARRATSAECVQHVLAVAGAELQPAHQPEDLGMQIVQPELEGDRLAFLAHRLVGLVLDLLRRPPRCAPGGCGRRRSAARSPACAISRRYGSKPERMIAPGVSSTIRSTPVASSSARMLRPSRPMMRPFRSSLGRSTTETVVSIACSAAQRWMASVMYCLARSAAVSRASASRRLSRFAASCRASPSICLSSSSLASSAVRLATRSSSCCCCATSCSYLAAAGGGCLLALGQRLRRAPAGPSRAARSAACRSASAASRRASVCSSVCACCRSCARLALGVDRAARAPFPWRRAALPSCGSRRRARRP